MPAAASPHFRFREFRERAGLSYDEAARLMGISFPAVRDIESYEDELSECYSATQVQQFCQVLGVRPSELFGVETIESPVSTVGLVRLIHEQCHSRGVTLEQFDDDVGWGLSECIDPPGRLLSEMPIVALQCLCRELGIHWHRVILSCDAVAE